MSLQWIILQLFAYQWMWLGFALVAFCTARFGGWRLVGVGFGIILVLVFAVGFTGICSPIVLPEHVWPTITVRYLLALFIYAIFVNVLLWPVTVLGLCLRRKSTLPGKSLVSSNVAAGNVGTGSKLLVGLFLPNALCYGILWLMADSLFGGGPESGFAALGMVMVGAGVFVVGLFLNIWVAVRSWTRLLHVFAAGCLIPYALLITLSVFSRCM